MDLQVKKGEEYVKVFPKLKKWINECVCCHRKGYDPNMPKTIGTVEGNLGAKTIRQYFKPLSVNEHRLCEVCAKLVPPQTTNGKPQNEPLK